MSVNLEKWELYLNREIFINFHGFSEDEDVLHEIGKLPHVAETIKQAHVSRFKRFHFCATTLPRHHIDDDAAPRKA